MRFKNIFSISQSLPIFLGLTLLLTSCSALHEDLQECRSVLKLKFKYEYHLKKSDAFAKEVTSVNVWAFDRNGAPVWKESVAGEILKDKDFSIVAPLPTGKYDFIAWCGLADNPDFNLSEYSPSSMEELEVTLATIVEDEKHSSSSHFQPLFHDVVKGVEYHEITPTETETTVTFDLVKDTNDIRVMLQNLDGTKLDRKDFTVYISTANSWLKADNNLHEDSKMVFYKPWDIRHGVIEGDSETENGRAITSVETLVYEMSTSRLMDKAKATLSVTRNSDGVEIINIPIIKYLLMVRGKYGDMSDQEYLDRQDEYPMIFFLDPDKSWDKTIGIRIGKWTVVPPQDEDY